MRDVIVAIAIGLAVGILYGVLRTRSPAPPPSALLGLAAMLAGERIVALIRPWF
jgi:XapX domain-containing protein